jgi:hypothetical protein
MFLLLAFPALAVLAVAPRASIEYLKGSFSEVEASFAVFNLDFEEELYMNEATSLCFNAYSGIALKPEPQILTENCRTAGFLQLPELHRQLRHELVQ